MLDDHWILLPFPPSVNTLYFQGPRHGQKFLSKKGKEYKAKAIELLANDYREPLTYNLKATYYFIPPDARTRDADNYIKAPSDALTASNFIEDDSQIRSFSATMLSKQLEYKKGMTIIHLEPYITSVDDELKLVTKALKKIKTKYEDL